LDANLLAHILCRCGHPSLSFCKVYNLALTPYHSFYTERLHETCYCMACDRDIRPDKVPEPFVRLLSGVTAAWGEWLVN